MGLTAFRNKQGIKGKPANMPGGGAPDAATLQNLYQTAANKGPSAAHDMVGQIGGPQVQAQVQAQMPGGGDDPMKAPRYQKMLQDGVDPDVVKKRAEAFQRGKLPGQQGVSGSGQTPGIVPGMPGQPTGRLPTAPGGGSDGRPNQLPSGARGQQDGGGRVATPGGIINLPGGAGGGLRVGNPGQGQPWTPRLPNGEPMGGAQQGNLNGGGPFVGGGDLAHGPGSASGPPLDGVGPTPYPLQIPGSQISPGAWGALGGGSPGPRLPNGQPMGGAGAAGGPGNMNPGGPFVGGGDQVRGLPTGAGAAGGPTPQNGGGLQSGPLSGNLNPGGPFIGGGDLAHLPPGAGLPYGNDGQVRQAPPGAGGPTPFVPREPPIPGPGGQAGGGGLTFTGGNEPSHGGRPLLPNGQPMGGAPPTATPDPQDRQAAVARGLAGRMGGLGFAQ